MADIEALRASGMNIDSLPEEQREALSKLDQSDVDALLAIREKLNEGEEVEGHSWDVARAGPDGEVLNRFGTLADGGLVW